MFSRGLWDYSDPVSVVTGENQRDSVNKAEKRENFSDPLTVESERNSRISHEIIDEIDLAGKQNQEENTISDQEIWHKTNFYHSSTTIFDRLNLTYRELFHRNSWRPCLLTLVTSRGFSSFIMMIILLNTIALILQTFEDIEKHAKWYLEGIDHIFGGIYLWELCLKLYVWRWGFFREKWNTLGKKSIIFIDRKKNSAI